MGNKTSNSAAIEGNNSNEERSSSSNSNNGNASANVDDVFIETDDDVELEGEISRDSKKVRGHFRMILQFR